MTEERHPKIVRLIELWRSLAPGPGLLPGRRHFDPLMVPDLLPNLWLIDVEPGPPRRFRLRLIGGRILAAGMPGRKGDLVDDPKIMDDPAAARRVLDAVVDTGELDWARGTPNVKHSRFVLGLERVLLPLAADGRTVDMMLCLTLFHHVGGRID